MGAAMTEVGGRIRPATARLDGNTRSLPANLAHESRSTRLKNRRPTQMVLTPAISTPIRFLLCRRFGPAGKAEA